MSCLIVLAGALYRQNVERSTRCYKIRVAKDDGASIGSSKCAILQSSALLGSSGTGPSLYPFGFGPEIWNLLRLVELMAYSLAAYKDLVPDLNIVELRRAVLHGKKDAFLREHPVGESTQSLMGLLGSNEKQSLFIGASSPVNADGGKIGNAAKGGRGGPSVTIDERSLRGEIRGMSIWSKWRVLMSDTREVGEIVKIEVWWAKEYINADGIGAKPAKSLEKLQLLQFAECRELCVIHESLLQHKSILDAT